MCYMAIEQKILLSLLSGRIFGLSLDNNQKGLESDICVVQSLDSIISLCTNVLLRSIHLQNFFHEDGNGCVATYAYLTSWKDSVTYLHMSNKSFIQKSLCVFLWLGLTMVETLAFEQSNFREQCSKRQRNADGMCLRLGVMTIVCESLCRSPIYIYIDI